ncbi:TIGR02444 family protein [Paraferrimonas haliotis]|uniref:TIGR02444 family protein n=1 Tax=Paraferrimonas haliotis TaxID=2013866 RepID=A0AA37TUZ2_9GAMM|nr:TIGR02444 family protein [Paraferrimonas haliotis]GLS83349.1 hypothetical protein GCM10007894_13260 [Paraferrimonas haliotis]
MLPIDWRKVERNYAQVQCKQALLGLQDEHEVDVNLALLALYCDQQRLTINPNCWPKLLATSALWQQQLAPLRAIRRRAKSGNPGYYQRLLAIELMLERQLQQQLTPLLQLSKSAGDNLGCLGQHYGVTSLVPALHPFV